jgi:hypothetical protein
MSSFVKWLSTYDSQPAQAGPAPLLLDAISSVAAYSVRKLRTAYAGACMRVRRSSDNAEADIGFGVSGNLDTTALLAHVGAGSGYVRTWYDQSGNARNAGQATAGYQARIVNAGVVDARPVFDGANDFYTLTGSFPVGSYCIAAGWMGGVAAGGILYARSSSSTKVANSDTSFGVGQTTSTSLFINDSPAPTGVWVNGSSIAVATATAWGTGASVTNPFTLSVNQAASPPSGTKNIVIGADAFAAIGSRHWDSSIGELLLFPAALSSDERGAMQSSQKAYFGTP